MIQSAEFIENIKYGLDQALLRILDAKIETALDCMDAIVNTELANHQRIEALDAKQRESKQEFKSS